jgi:GMP synthase-like glutamine amidotransferase
VTPSGGVTTFPLARPAAGRPRRVLVLQHHPDEDPGALGPLLGAAGFALRAVELDAGEAIPDLSPFDALLVMGGPQHVWEEDEHPWLVEEKAAIRHWVADLERPFLGVCLGHQLLADALGGTVEPMAVPEIGVHFVELTPSGVADPVVGQLPNSIPGLQWHEAEVVEAPPGALVLAGNEYSAVQALRAGPAAWGVQFHLEVGPGTVRKWAAVPEYARTLTETFGSVRLLEEAVARHLGVMSAATAVLVGAFLDAAFDGAATRASSGSTAAGAGRA